MKRDVFVASGRMFAVGLVVWASGIIQKIRPAFIPYPSVRSEERYNKQQQNEHPKDQANRKPNKTPAKDGHNRRIISRLITRTISHIDVYPHPFEVGRTAFSPSIRPFFPVFSGSANGRSVVSFIRKNHPLQCPLNG